MANRKISELNSASILTGVEEFALVQDSETKKGTISGVRDYINTQPEDYTVIIVQDGQTLDLGVPAYSNTNFIQLKWSGGSGNQNMTIQLPSVVQAQSRMIRLITNGSFTSNTHARITPDGIETIDGSNEYVINRQYEGVTLWSDGLEWTIIQAKSH